METDMALSWLSELGKRVFGSMDGLFYTLVAFVVIDYITGVCVAIHNKQLSSDVRDKDDDKRIIADWDDLNNTNYHHNNTLANGSTTSKSNRTLLGHKANGAFVLVCTWCGMDLRVAAKMMADLGCDYAVNMDGSSAIRMRVASGYTNGVKDPGQVCGNNNTKHDYYGTASCVYLT